MKKEKDLSFMGSKIYIRYIEDRGKEREKESVGNIAERVEKIAGRNSREKERGREGRKRAMKGEGS